jgi:hypothetical protein
MSYRPITDIWILGRCKHKYYGGYPAGFLHRARQLLGVHTHEPVLHVCGGKVRDYPYRGFGPFDKTLDLDPGCKPDFLQDARLPLPAYICTDATCLQCEDGDFVTGAKGHLWPAILIDRPYSDEDADHYVPGRDKLPAANVLVKNAIQSIAIGSKVGILDYVWPHCPKNAIEVATIGVTCGRNNRMRQYTVFERLK